MKASKKKKAGNYTESSGNVFLDLGFDPVEADILLTRSKMMMDLTDYIKKNALTQSEAAKIFGVTQSRVSDLVRGKFNKFSLEMLISLEGKIGRRVVVKVAA